MTTRYLDTPHGSRIAYVSTPGASPAVVFLGGFMSDMTGSKATALEAHCRAVGRAYVRFDYLGHGQSGGRFADGTVSAWLADALAVIDTLTAGDLILVGSSMGGWISMLAAKARPDRVKGIIGIAAAADFTQKLMWASYDDAQRATLLTQGFIHVPTEYGDEPYVITRALIEDGAQHQLLDAPYDFPGPIHLLQGQADPDVPWEWALKIADVATSPDVIVTLTKQGDHRLSTPEDLKRLTDAVETMASKILGEAA